MNEAEEMRKLANEARKIKAGDIDRVASQVARIVINELDGLIKKWAPEGHYQVQSPKNLCDECWQNEFANFDYDRMDVIERKIKEIVVPYYKNKGYEVDAETNYITVSWENAQKEKI